MKVSKASKTLKAPKLASPQSPIALYEKRRQKLYDWMAEEGTHLVMLEDSERFRDPSVRWLSGHPGDALLFLAIDRRCILAPWDINMAMLHAEADAFIPYADLDLRPEKALQAVTAFCKMPKGMRIEIPASTPYPTFLKYVEELSDYDVICHEGGIWEEIELSRSVKDEAEITLYRTISAYTNEIIDRLEANVRSGKLTTEIDIALFIEAQSRAMGCEGSGFPTIAAGPARSFAIHAFPPHTSGAFGGDGLSILDFGIKLEGYTSEVTLTFARGDLSKAQEKMLTLVEKAHKIALSMVKGGVPARSIGAEVDAFFARSKKKMPHGLGHGIGLDVHEPPNLRSRSDNNWVLEPGMIITIEPALYDPVHGGCRMENNILVTETGAEQLTAARIIRL